MRKTILKRVLSVVTVAAIAVSMVAFTGCGKKGYTANNTEFVIGCSGPLTGGASLYGTAVRNAAQMAVDEINANGGLDGVKFKFVMMDDMHDATKISTNYSSLYESGMQLSLGTVTTAPGLEWKTLAAEDNVFFLSPSASGDDVPKVDCGYQMCFADGNQGKVAAEYVNANLKNTTIGVFYKSDDAYSKGIFTQFKQNLDASITLKETVFTDANTSDFSTQIDTLKDCKFIFLPIYATPASLFAKQAASIMTVDTIYYGCDGLDGIDSIDGFDITTIPQEISMLSHFNSKAESGVAKEFIDKYVAEFGKETLNQFGASAYDCIYALFNALKEIKAENADAFTVTTSASDFCELLKAKFNGGYSYSGVTGENITWDSVGYVNKTAIKYVIKESDNK